MERLGPLQTEPDGLSVGDPGGHHLLLRSDLISGRTGVQSHATYRWNDVHAMRLELPVSRFRFTSHFSTAASALITALSGHAPEVDPPSNGFIVLDTEHGETREPVTRHHSGGYWKPAVEATQQLLNLLIADRSLRELLDNPDRLLLLIRGSRFLR